MGRPEKPIAPCGKALQALARWLRIHRSKAGLSYEMLATRTQGQYLPDGRSARCSADTLARAASGRGVPRLETVLAFSIACGEAVDTGEAERLWKRARYEESRAKKKNEEPVPHISYVRNFAELRTALLDLYHKDGSRPYQQLERMSNGLLAHSTVARFIGGVTGRPTRQFVTELARVCGVRGIALREWAHAWERAEEKRLGYSRINRRRRAGILVSEELSFQINTFDSVIDAIALKYSNQRASRLRAVRNLGALTAVYDRVRLADGNEAWVRHFNRLSAEQASVRETMLELENLSALTSRELEEARSVFRASKKQKRK